MAFTQLSITLIVLDNNCFSLIPILTYTQVHTRFIASTLIRCGFVDVIQACCFVAVNFPVAFLQQLEVDPCGTIKIWEATAMGYRRFGIETGSAKPVVVYHGSTSLLDVIDVAKGKPYKDFGRGFYVTESKNHARNIALRNKRIETERFNRPCEAFIYSFEMDIFMLSSFKVKQFFDADFEWVQFVLANRKTRERAHGYDVVIGPTANDDTMVVLNAYLDGLYGNLGSEGALNTLLTNIEAENLPGQIYFSSNDATKMLIQKGMGERL